DDAWPMWVWRQEGQPLRIVVPIIKPPPPPPPPTEAVIRFASTPAGATVRVVGRDEVLGTTPFVARFPRGSAMTFTFDLDGYIPSLRAVTMSGDGEVAAELLTIPPPVDAPPPEKHKRRK